MFKECVQYKQCTQNVHSEINEQKVYPMYTVYKMYTMYTKCTQSKQKKSIIYLFAVEDLIQ